MAKYTVTDIAPSRVAGRPVLPGDTLELTATAAAYELLAGHITPVADGGSKADQTAIDKAKKS